MEQPIGFFGEYAQVYARADYASFARDIAVAMRLLLEERGLTRPRVLDLACGTGLMLRTLTEDIEYGLGVDQSPFMLEIAEATPTANLTYKLGDIREPHANSQFDVVTIVYNTVNYLLAEADLERAICSARTALQPGGLLLFDAHEPEYFQHHWAGRSFIVQNKEDIFEATSNYFVDGGQVLCTDLTWFVRQGDLWQRGSDTHYSVGWSRALMRRLLERNGLSLLAEYGDLPGRPTTEENERVWFLAER